MKITITIKPRPLTAPDHTATYTFENVIQVNNSIGQLYRTYVMADGTNYSFLREIIIKEEIA